MASIYRTDKKYWWAAAFIIVLGCLMIWDTWAAWPYVVGFWALVGLIAYLYRRSA